MLKPLFIFTLLLLAIIAWPLSCCATASQCEIKKAISPNGKYIITSSVGKRKVEVDEIPEVVLSMRSQDTGAQVARLSTILETTGNTSFADNLTIVWSTDSSCVALYFEAGHGHSFLDVYLIKDGRVKQVDVPDRPGYAAASKAAGSHPGKDVKDVNWATFSVDNLQWNDDKDLAARVHYLFAETNTSVTVFGHFFLNKSRWVFGVERVERD